MLVSKESARCAERQYSYRPRCHSRLIKCHGLFPHSGKGLQADIRGPAVAGLADNIYLILGSPDVLRPPQCRRPLPRHSQKENVSRNSQDDSGYLVEKTSRQPVLLAIIVFFPAISMTNLAATAWPHPAQAVCPAQKDVPRLE